MSESEKQVLSPLLHVTPFVGESAPHKLQEGKPWLWCPAYGFSFCVGGIDEYFGSFSDGECVRIEIDREHFRGAIEYSVYDACSISKLADRMMGKLFRTPVESKHFDQAVIEHHMLTEDGVIDTDEVVRLVEAGGDLPGVIFYRVVRV